MNAPAGVARIVVLASGSGGNLQAVLDACASGVIRGRVVAVFSDRPGAFALERAARSGIPGFARPPVRGVSRIDYDSSLGEAAGAFEPDLVLLLGWMRLLSRGFLDRFAGRVVNLHPALPGKYPGVAAIERAFADFSAGLCRKTGVMIHYVPDEGVDDGPVIAVEEVPVFPDDSLGRLESRIHETEHRLIVAAVARLARDIPASAVHREPAAATIPPQEVHMPVALVSVSDKRGLADFAGALASRGWSFLASGGTAKHLADHGLRVVEISDYSGSPEMLGGRVKTLHPAVHGGILARGTTADGAELSERGWGLIDMVVVNLYPFEETVARPGAPEADCVENIDIGGVALVRAAAKNHDRVVLVCDPDDYESVAAEIAGAGSVSPGMRRALAAKGFARTASYDAAIASWMAPGKNLLVRGHGGRKLRYGENPHQEAFLYSSTPGSGPLGGSVLQGKELSYNNILDLDAAWKAVRVFDGPAVVVVKHLSPCGVATGATPARSLAAALACDPVSAFGGVVACNRRFDGAGARALGDLFVECVAAPGFDDEARAILAGRKNARLLDMPATAEGRPVPPTDTWEIRSVEGGFLRQSVDRGDPDPSAWRVVSRREPGAGESKALAFAWKACIAVKSNGILLAAPHPGTPGDEEFASVGIGAGQPNRVDSVRIAVTRAGSRAAGSVMASDAFFPFPDSIEEAAKAGVTAIVHPGGSLRDALGVEAADKAGIALVVTGVRHFRH